MKKKILLGLVVVLLVVSLTSCAMIRGSRIQGSWKGTGEYSNQKLTILANVATFEGIVEGKGTFELTKSKFEFTPDGKKNPISLRYELKGFAKNQELKITIPAGTTMAGIPFPLDTTVVFKR